MSTPSAEQGHLGHPSRRRGNGPLKRLRAVGRGYATFAVPSGGLLGRRRLSLEGEVTVPGARRGATSAGGCACWLLFLVASPMMWKIKWRILPVGEVHDQLTGVDHLLSALAHRRVWLV